MVRSRVVMVVIGVFWAAVSEAQSPQYTGMFTGHVGVANGGDVREGGLTLGGSMVVVEAGGLGAEIDLGHTRQFDADLFSESGITTLMMNAVGMWPRGRVRPFVGAGVGLVRARASVLDGVQVVNRTDWGLNAGGGVVYLLKDSIGVRGDVRYFRYFERHDDLPRLDSGFFDFWRTSVGVTFAWPLR